MLTLFYTSIMVIIAAGHIKARKNKFDTFLDIMNETKLIVIMYHMILFTDFVPEFETKHNIGYSCLATVCLGIAINMAVIFI